MDPLRQPPSPCSSRPSSPRTPSCEMLGYVGIEAVLDQLKIKAMKMGFEFNIMVVGQSGLGKSTMVNTLFKSKMWKSTLPGLGVPTPKTLQLQSVTHVIEEKGVKLKLTVTDTPGFGDQINNDKCWDPILGYINEQYERYLQEEILITRQRHIPDTRVHCCVYFVPPTGHCLRPLDIEFLQRLCQTVNVVPVIARADSLTIEEREAFRRRIQHNLRTHCIEVYPQKCFDEDINDRILNSKIRERIPFAVVGADREHLVNGRCVLGRKTKWGIIEVENMAHCEFPLLRDLLIRTHLQDLKDITHNVHYENYRVFRLNKSHVLPRGPGWVNLAPGPAPSPASPQATPRTMKVCRWTQDNSDDEY
ncbi:septin-12 isoform X2 [Vicugna pacos]|uniref:Septin n=1 Tax=Vicugna pacos TaxID=30538 RepID=A0A6I9I7H5_VICPA|nr:septin-12 [Vicugna pacos]